jgi:hypothetical protein
MQANQQRFHRSNFGYTNGSLVGGGLCDPVPLLPQRKPDILCEFNPGLNERPTENQGWIGCTLCIIGSVVLALNAPEEQSVTTIASFKRLFLAPGFLVWASILIIVSLVLIFYAVPRWGKKTMMVYISICSLIGGISVSCTQGLGASIVATIGG